MRLRTCLSTRPRSSPPDVREGIAFYRLFDEAESVRWKMADRDFGRSAQTCRRAFEPWREMLKSELTTFSATELLRRLRRRRRLHPVRLNVWFHISTPSALLCWLDALGERSSTAASCSRGA
ncbi:MAG: hypothetical protein R3F14_07105 [Polyangiaceae bacterium]